MDQLKNESTKLRAALTTRIKDILRNSSSVGVLKEGVVQTELLHRARYNLSILNIDDNLLT
jgi:hypothetical protein